MYIYCSTVHSNKDLEPTQMPMNDRLDKENVAIYTMEYYAAIKKDKIMFFAGTWMMLDTIHSQQTNTRTENQTLHVLTQK